MHAACKISTENLLRVTKLFSETTILCMACLLFSGKLGTPNSVTANEYR